LCALEPTGHDGNGHAPGGSDLRPDPAAMTEMVIGKK